MGVLWLALLGRSSNIFGFHKRPQFPQELILLFRYNQEAEERWQLSSNTRALCLWVQIPLRIRMSVYVLFFFVLSCLGRYTETGSSHVQRMLPNIQHKYTTSDVNSEIYRAEGHNPYSPKTKTYKKYPTEIFENILEQANSIVNTACNSWRSWYLSYFK